MNKVTENSAQLREMFSNLDVDVIEEVLHELNGDLDRTIDKLFLLSDDSSPVNSQHSAETAFIAELNQMFPDIDARDLQTIAKHYNYKVYEIIDTLVQGEPPNTPTKQQKAVRQQDHKLNLELPQTGNIKFESMEEQRAYEFIIDLCPKNIVVVDHVRKGLLELLRDHGFDYVVDLVTKNPQLVSQKIKAMRKRRKKNRQQSNTAKTRKLTANTGCGNSITSQWNTGSLLESVPVVESLKDSAEFPKGTTCLRPKGPGIWKNQTISQELKFQKLKEKYPALEDDILRDILAAGSTNEAEIHILEILLVDTDEKRSEGDISDISKPYQNPNHESLPGGIRYRPESNQNADDFVQVLEKKRRKKKKEKNELSQQRAREEALWRGQLMATYVRCAALAFQSGCPEKARQYASKGKQMKQEMDEYHKLAAQLIMQSNRGMDGKHLTVDCHGLYVNEAIENVDKVLEELQRIPKDNRPDVLEIITGIGNRSGNGPRIKPRIIEHLKSANIPFSSVDGAIVIRFPFR